MAKPIKIGIVFLAVLLVIFVALAVVIQTQLTPERVRSTFLPLVEKQLGRNVTLGEIEIGLFSGVSLHELTVMEADGQRQFLSVGSSRLSYRLWPLLRGQLLIREFSLEKPVISLIREADGSFNFSDMLPQGPDDGSVQSRGPSSSSSATPFDLLIQTVSIRSGEIHIIDRLINPAAPFRYTVNQLDLRARQITLDGAFPVELSCVLHGARVTMSGQYDVARQSGSMMLRLDPLDLIPFAPYYRDAVPGTLGKAHLAVNVDADITPQRIQSRGKIQLEDVDLVLTELPDMPLRGVKLTTDYAIEFNPHTSLLEISTLLFQFNDIKASVQGRLDLAPQTPRLEADVAMNRLELRQATASLPQSVARSLQPFSPAGELDIRMKLSGAVDSGAALVQSAQLRLQSVQATVNALRAGINGEINYARGVLRSDNISLRYGDQQANLTFALENLLQHPIEGTFALSAKELNLDKIMPDGESSPPTPGRDEPVPTEVEIGPYDLPLVLNGTASIDRVIYNRLQIQQFRASIALKNNRLSFDPVSGRVAGGEFGVTSVVDLGVRGLAYQGQLVLSQGDLATLVAGLFPLTDQQFGGQMQWVNNFAGRGTRKESLLRALQLDGQVVLLQGLIAGLPLQDQVSTFLGSPDLKSISFREFQGNYRMRDGRMRLDSRMDGSQVGLTPSGTLGVDGSLELKLPVRLSPEVMGRMGASDRLKQAFVDSSGWGVLPLHIGGSLTSPRVGFDNEALQKQAVEQVTRELEQRLLEKLVPQSAEEESKEPLRNLLDGTLRRLRTP